jgi:hypothetical protein
MLDCEWHRFRGYRLEIVRILRFSSCINRLVKPRDPIAIHQKNDEFGPIFPNRFPCILTLLCSGPCINPWLRHSSSPTCSQVIVFHHHRSVPSRTSSSKHPLEGIQARRTTTPSMLISTSSPFHPLSEIRFCSRQVKCILDLSLLIISTSGIVSHCCCRLLCQPLEPGH